MTQAGQPDFSGGVSEISFFFFLLELLSGRMEYAVQKANSPTLWGIGCPKNVTK